MKQFNLEEFVKGKPAQTRDGRDVEFVSLQDHTIYVFKASMYDRLGGIDTFSFTKEGKYYDKHVTNNDLFMKDEESKQQINCSTLVSVHTFVLGIAVGSITTAVLMLLMIWFKTH